MPKPDEPKVARTYNQDHKARKYAKGRRRVSVYVAWSYPAEKSNRRSPAVLDNRFSTMTEVRRVVLAPCLRGAAMGPAAWFQQGIGAGRSNCSSGRGCRSSASSRKSPRGTPSPCSSASDQAGFAAPARRTGAGRHGHAVRLLWSGSHGHGAGARTGRDRGCPRVPRTRRDLPRHRPSPRRRSVGGPTGTPDGIPAPRRRAGPEATALRHALHARARGTGSGSGSRIDGVCAPRSTSRKTVVSLR